VRNCRWTIVTDRHSWNVSTQNAFSLPFASILVNCAPSAEMPNYCTPHIKETTCHTQTLEIGVRSCTDGLRNSHFLIRRCNYILLSQVYCVWQFVKTPTFISNNPVFGFMSSQNQMFSVVLKVVSGRIEKLHKKKIQLLTHPQVFSS
jgi:hypothetical protein